MLKKLERILSRKFFLNLYLFKKLRGKYGGEKDTPEFGSRQAGSTDEPPSHWLMMVRKGAPHLINSPSETYDSSFHDNGMNSDIQKKVSITKIITTGFRWLISIFDQFRELIGKNWTEKNVSAFESQLANPKNGPPQHWLKKVRKGAPHLLSPQSSAARSSSIHHVDDGIDRGDQEFSEIRKDINARGLFGSRSISDNSRDITPVNRIEKFAIVNKEPVSKIFSTNRMMAKFAQKIISPYPRLRNEKAFFTSFPAENNQSFSRKNDSSSDMTVENEMLEDKYLATNPERFSGVRNAEEALNNSDNSVVSFQLQRDISVESHNKFGLLKKSFKQFFPNFYRRLLENDSKAESADLLYTGAASSYKAIGKSEECKKNQSFKSRKVFDSIGITHVGFNSKRSQYFKYEQPLDKAQRNSKRVRLGMVVSENQSTLQEVVKEHLGTTEKSENEFLNYSDSSAVHSCPDRRDSANEKVLDVNESKIRHSSSSRYFGNSRNIPNRNRESGLIPGRNNSFSSSRSFISDIEQLSLNESLWPSLSNEVTTSFSQSSWPRLSDYESGSSSKLIEFEQIDSLYFRLQEVANRAVLSDLEQRGKLWNV